MITIDTQKKEIALNVNKKKLCRNLQIKIARSNN